ncbi:MAG: cation acetate symporter [Hyphomicrobium sp.]
MESPLVASVRTINPRLGAYYSIFLSAFIAVGVLGLILEQLGVDAGLLGLGILFVPIFFYIVIGISTYTNDVLDFFTAGRRIPSFFNGLALAITAFGATGLVTFTGLLFLIGFDALFYGIGVLSGFVMMAVLLAPFLRKFGAFTIPSYLGRRFDSKNLRYLSAFLIFIPILLVLCAEIQLATTAAQKLSNWSKGQVLFLLLVIFFATLLPGGMRSLTWTSIAQGLAVLVAAIVPAAIVSVLLTNLPLSQLTHGPILRAIGRNEAIQGLPIILPPLLAFDIPGPELQPILKRFASPFGAVGSLSYVLGTLSVVAGIASAPWLLPRLATTPSVFEARKTLGWATFIFGILILTSSSIAVFFRDYIMDLISIKGASVIPDWLQKAVQYEFASVSTTGTNFSVSSFNFARDGVFYSLPLAAHLPSTIFNLSLVGVLAAGLVTASAAATALGHILSEDILFGSKWELSHSARRLHVSRACVGLLVCIGILAAEFIAVDPFRLVLWALSLCGSAFFSILVLSIWWKRINALGAMAGMVTGYFVTLVGILGAEESYTMLDSALAAGFGLPSSLIAALLVSLVSEPPRRHLLELVRDIRVPGGEIVYDREIRTQKAKKR